MCSPGHFLRCNLVPLSTMKGKSCVPLARLLDPLLISCNFLIVLEYARFVIPFNSPRCKHFEYSQVFMCDGSLYIPWHCSNSFNGHQLLLCVFNFLCTFDCNLYVSSTGISIYIQSLLNHYVKTFSLGFFNLPNFRVRTTYVTVPPALRPLLIVFAWPRLETSVPFRRALPLHSTSLPHFLSAFSSSTPDMLPCLQPTSPHVSSPDCRPY